jgi:hypothetical protein
MRLAFASLFFNKSKIPNEGILKKNNMPSIKEVMNKNQNNKELHQKLKERIKYHHKYRKWRLKQAQPVFPSKKLKTISLEKRYKSIIKSDDLVFIRGIADYVEAIKRSVSFRRIIASIHDKEDESYKKVKNGAPAGGAPTGAFANSIWGSWFYLELIYLLHYQPNEIENIFGKRLDPSNIPFDKEFYIVDINRVHFHLLEQSSGLFDSNSNEEAPINYRFNSIGSSRGTLKIKGFAEVHFHKQIAQVLQFFNLSLSLNTYSDYQDYNKFIGTENIQITSNRFRLLINSINSRVSQATKGIVKELIIKQGNSSKARTANRYKMIDF